MNEVPSVESDGADITAPRRKLLPPLRWMISAIVAGLLTAVLLAFQFRGNPMATLPLTVGVAFLIGLPAVLTACLLLVVSAAFAARGVQSKAGLVQVLLILGRGAVFIALFSLAQLPGVIVSGRLGERDRESAMAYCDGLVPRLDAWKAEHGSYPSSLDEFGESATVREFHCRIGYSAEGDQFTFGVDEPTAVLAGWSYDSTNRVWKFSNW